MAPALRASWVHRHHTPGTQHLVRNVGCGQLALQAGRAPGVVAKVIDAGGRAAAPLRPWLRASQRAPAPDPRRQHVE